jgi:hypothetical protein
MNEEQAVPPMNEEQAVPQPTTSSQVELSKEQREQREQLLRLEILKRWEIKILPLDRGCTVSVGCKSVAFESIDTAMEMVKRYVDNPVAVINHYRFENHI